MFTRGARSAWSVLVWLVLFMLPIQFYLAGFGAFGFHNSTVTSREDAWGLHAAFGTLIGVIVLLVLLTAVAGRLERSLLGPTGALFVLMIVQMILPAFGDASSTRFIAALHPVNAIFITGVTIMLARRARQYLPIKRFQTAGEDAGGSRASDRQPAGAGSQGSR